MKKFVMRKNNDKDCFDEGEIKKKYQIDNLVWRSTQHKSNENDDLVLRFNSQEEYEQHLKQKDDGLVLKFDTLEEYNKFQTNGPETINL